MATLESLLERLDEADGRHDFDSLRTIRQEIVDQHPDSEAAVEAEYKLGLDFLFRQRDLDAANAYFESAARRKHPFWSAASRTSLGLCLFHQKRTQKALFELRRVGYADPPTVHSVTAMAFIENILESLGKIEDVKRVRKDRISQLEKLIDINREEGGRPSRSRLLPLPARTGSQGQRGASRCCCDSRGSQTHGPPILGSRTLSFGR